MSSKGKGKVILVGESQSQRLSDVDCRTLIMNIKFATKSSQKSETHLEPEVENISFKIVVDEVFDSKDLQY